MKSIISHSSSNEFVLKKIQCNKSCPTQFLKKAKYCAIFQEPHFLNIIGFSCFLAYLLFKVPTYKNAFTEADLSFFTKIKIGTYNSLANKAVGNREVP